MKLLLSLLLFLVCSTMFAVSLEWTTNDYAEGVTQYKIYRVNSNGSASAVGTVSAPTVTFNVDSLLNSNQTKFFVTAVNMNGESVKSSTVAVKKH